MLIFMLVHQISLGNFKISGKEIVHYPQIFMQTITFYFKKQRKNHAGNNFTGHTQKRTQVLPPYRSDGKPACARSSPKGNSSDQYRVREVIYG